MDNISLIFENFNITILERIYSSTNQAFMIEIDKQVYFAKLKKLDFNIEKECELIKLLNSNDIKVPTILKVIPLNDENINVLCLYEVINSYKLDKIEYSNIGKMIGKIHQVISQYIDENRLHLVNEIEDKCINYIQRYNYKIYGLINEIMNFEEVISFRKLYCKLPVQTIHGDIHNENIIFNETLVLGFYDLENVLFTIRIYDLCYYILSLLDYTKKSFHIKDWLTTIKMLLLGYSTKVQLIEDELISIYGTMIYIEILKLTNSIINANKAMVYSAMNELKILIEYKETINNVIGDVSFGK